MKNNLNSFVGTLYGLILIICVLSSCCDARRERQRANPVRETSMGESNPQQSSALLMVESGVHYYPSVLFYKQYKDKKNPSKEFKLIQSVFRSQKSKISKRKYQRFLRKYLVRNMFEDEDAPVTGLHELLSRFRVKLLVSGYISGTSQKTFTLEDCYSDLYIGKLFDWLLKQSEDL